MIHCKDKEIEMIFYEDTVQVFLDKIFPDLTQNEVVFLSLSARAKYLKNSERQLYSLSHNEMFHRRWFTADAVRNGSVPDYIRSIRTTTDKPYLDGISCLADYTDKYGVPLPEHAVAVYLNINPSDMRLAAVQLQKRLLDMMGKDLTTAGDPHDYTKLQSMLNTEVQKARSRRVWVDIDMDFHNIPEKEEIISAVENRFPPHSNKIIKTRSGYHVLLDAAMLKEEKVNLGQIIRNLNDIYRSRASEIVINRNAMIPLPGTYQGGVQVEWV
jgi:hypothetical protein